MLKFQVVQPDNAKVRQIVVHRGDVIDVFAVGASWWLVMDKQGKLGCECSPKLL
jgi:hypothetical protein